jgi:hypothetical protein
VTILDRRARNRALLDRQMLLRRSQRPALGAVEALVGMQAQMPTSPYIGLWTRLERFDPAELSNLVTTREVVRIALMRSTIHLVSARDCLELRPLVQPAIERGFKGAWAKRASGLDFEAVAAAGREILTEQPLSAAPLGRLLQERWPAHAPDVLANVVRTVVPLVQVPPRGVWGASGSSAHTPADVWLGKPLAAKPSIDDMVVRYLAAFGPATVQDAQTWSGITKLAEVFDRLSARLCTFRDEDNRTLFDLPDAPRPHPEVEAPPRFLPEFDNVLLSHADRSHIVADEHRALFMANNFVVGTVLVDGHVDALWRVARTKDATTLTVELLSRRTKAEKDAIATEAAGLVAMLAPKAQRRDVTVS